MKVFWLMAALPSSENVLLEVMARMDADGDGVLTAAEYAPFDDRDSFFRMDADKNGKVTIEEFKNYLRTTDPARNRPHSKTPTVAPLLSSSATPSPPLPKKYLYGIALISGIFSAFLLYRRKFR